MIQRLTILSLGQRCDRFLQTYSRLGATNEMSVGAQVENLSVEPVSGTAVLVLVAGVAVEHGTAGYQKTRRPELECQRPVDGLWLGTQVLVRPLPDVWPIQRIMVLSRRQT